MKHVFHPLVGDTAHGDGKQNQLFRAQFNCHRLLLHAQSLQFQHPHTKKEILITAALDDSFSSIIEQVFGKEMG
jgi:tRNA pseudouridine65 synthase